MLLMRRRFLKLVTVLGGMMLLPRMLFAARPDQAFTAEARDDALKALFGNAEISPSDAITLSVPEIAENGAVVPVSASSTLDRVDMIAVIINGNPNPLVASFEIGPRTLPDISTRVKMGETSVVTAIVRADAKLYSTEKEVKVTIGGCGG